MQSFEAGNHGPRPPNMPMFRLRSWAKGCLQATTTFEAENHGLRVPNTPILRLRSWAKQGLQAPENF